MSCNHTARPAGRGSADADAAIVDVEGWANEAALRSNRSILRRAGRTVWRVKCWLLRKGLVSSIS